MCTLISNFSRTKELKWQSRSLIFPIHKCSSPVLSHSEGMTPPKYYSYYWYPRNSKDWVLTILLGWSLRPSVLVLSSRGWFCYPLHYLMALRTWMDKSEVRRVLSVQSVPMNQWIVNTCNKLKNLWTLLFLFLCHILKLKWKSQCKSHL